MMRSSLGLQSRKVMTKRDGVERGDAQSVWLVACNTLVLVILMF
jgi:hypothetical protein